MAVTVALIAPISTQAGTWTSPVVLSTGGQGWEATAAIDGAGNSIALWDERTTQDQIWSRSKASGGNPFKSPRQDLRRPYGAIQAAYGPPIARPLPNGNLLNF
jgi:hypothetical protein